MWMVNMRGNTYSRNHTTLDTCSKCPEFWDYCWHEGGTQDFAAVIDYMLEKTEQEKVFFVGHSMGTTQYLVSQLHQVMDSIGVCYHGGPQFKSQQGREI